MSIFLLSLLFLPIAYLVALLILFIKRRRTGLLLSLIFFIAAIGLGTWAIFQSRSSTAGIGILFLPFIGIATAALAWGFANLRRAQLALLRALAWLCLLAGLAILGWELNGGWQTIQLNKTRDAAQQARSQAIEQQRIFLKELLANNKGREAASLTQFIAQHHDDETALLSALASEYASAEQLDTYAQKDEFALTLTALRNKNCSAATLARIYRSHTYPTYFLHALAVHEHTPPDILREIFKQSPRPVGGLDVWLAANPATPKDILQTLSDSTDIQILQSLLQNPQLDCAQLTRASVALTSSTRPDDDYSVRQIAYLRPQLCRN
ncbi:MAG: hypothetical protein ACXW1C_05150 [Gallionella sp.]